MTWGAKHIGYVRPERMELDELCDRSGVARRKARIVLVLLKRHGLVREHTLSEIADTLGVTSERIRQIESAALSKMRQPKLKHKLREYLDEYVA